MRWPLAWVQPETTDRVLRLVIRLVGVGSLALFAIALLGLIAGIQALIAPIDGWGDLIAVLAFMIGLGAALLGAGLSWWAHVASRSGKGVMGGALAMLIIGSTFWAPLAWQEFPTPLDRYVAALRLGIMVLGAVAVWRISRNQSRPA